MPEGNEHAETIRLNVEAGDFGQAIAAVEAFGERLRQQAVETRASGQEFDAQAQIRAHQQVIDQAVKGFSSSGKTIDVTGVTNAFSEAFDRIARSIQQDLLRITEALEQGYRRTVTAGGQERFFRAGRRITAQEGRSAFGIAAEETRAAERATQSTGARYAEMQALAEQAARAAGPDRSAEEARQANRRLLDQYRGQATRTVFRGENNLTRGGTFFSTNEEYARKFAGDQGRLLAVQVPEVVAAEAERRARAGGNVGLDLPSQWAAAAHEVEAQIEQARARIRVPVGGVDPFWIRQGGGTPPPTAPGSGRGYGGPPGGGGPPRPPAGPTGPVGDEEPEFAEADAIREASLRQRVSQERASAIAQQTANARTTEEIGQIATGSARRMADQARIQAATFEQLPAGLAGFNARRSRQLQDEASRYGIDTTGMSDVRARYAVGRYQRLEAQSGLSAEELRGLNLGQVNRALADMAAEARALAQAERTAVANLEHPQTFREALAASVAGIGGYRSASRLPPSALAGSAVGALARGAIGGAAFNAFFAFQSGLTNAVDEAIQLDKSLAGLRETVSAVGASGGTNFTHVRDSILSISDATGVAGADVVTLAETFLGLTGNMNEATTSARAAAQFIEITGANAQEAGQQMASLQQLYGISAAQQLNAATAAAQQFGRGSPQGIAGIQAGVAALAPVGQQYGFSANQLYGLIGLASRGSALDSGTIGTQLDRALENILPNVGKLSQLGVHFSNASNLQTDLIDILGQANQLSPTNRRAVLNTFGNPRDIQALSSLFSAGPQQLQAALSGNYTASTAGDQRARDVSRSAAVTFERLRESATGLAESLIQSGLGAAFVRLAADTGTLLEGFGRFTGLLSGANNALGGIPGHIAEAMLGLGVINRLLPGTRGITDIPGFGGRAGRIIFGQTRGQRHADTEQGRNTAALGESTSALRGLTEAADQAAGALRGDAIAAEEDAGAQRSAAVGAGENALASKTGGLGGLATRLGLTQSLGQAGLLRTLGGVAVAGYAGYEIGSYLNRLNQGHGLPSEISRVATTPITAPARFLGEAVYGPGGPLRFNRFGESVDAHGNAQIRDLRGQDLGSRRNALAQLDYVNRNLQRFRAVEATIGDPRRRAEFQFDLTHAASANTYQQLLQLYSQYGQTGAGQAAIAGTPQGEQQAAVRRYLAAVHQEAVATGNAPGSVFGVAAPAQAADIGTVQQMLQQGAVSWQGAMEQMRQVIQNDASNPLQQFADAMQAATIRSQQATTAIGYIVQFGQQLRGFTPAQALAAQSQAVAVQAYQGNLSSQDIINAATQAASMVQSDIQYQLQNTALAGVSRTGVVQGGNVGAVTGGLQRLLTSGQLQTPISGTAASLYNQQLQKQGFAPEFMNAQGQAIGINGATGNAVTAQLTPDQIASGAQTLVQQQQAATAQLVANAQLQQKSTAQISAIQVAGDRAAINALTPIAQAHPENVQVQNQLIQLQTKLAQDQYQAAQTTLQNMQSFAQFQAALNAQDPLQAASATLNALGQEAQVTGRSIQSLMAQASTLQGFSALSQEQQQIVTQYAQALNQYFQAQQGLIQSVGAVAQSQAAMTGNAPAGALAGLKSAQAQLANFEATYPQLANAGNSTFNNLVAAVNNAKANYLTTTISFTEGVLQQEVTNNQISIGQAINSLKALQVKAAQAGNFAEVESIQTAIQQYINQGNQNAQFNLPSNINLPTLYEVRRTEGTQSGANYYGNNGTVNVQINIGGNADVQSATNQLMQALNSGTSGTNLPPF